MGHTQLGPRLDEVVLPERPEPEIPHSEVMTTMTALLALGKPDFEAVEEFREDPFFTQALDLAQPPSGSF